MDHNIVRTGMSIRDSELVCRDAQTKAFLLGLTEPIDGEGELCIRVSLTDSDDEPPSIKAEVVGVSKNAHLFTMDLSRRSILRLKEFCDRVLQDYPDEWAQ